MFGFSLTHPILIFRLNYMFYQIHLFIYFSIIVNKCFNTFVLYFHFLFQQICVLNINQTYFFTT